MKRVKIKSLILVAIISLPLIQYSSNAQTESLDSVVKTVVQAFNDRDTTLLKEVIIPERFHVEPPDSLIVGMDKAAFTYEATQMMHVSMFNLSVLMAADALKITIPTENLKYETELAPYPEMENVTMIHIPLEHDTYKWFQFSITKYEDVFFVAAPFYRLTEKRD